MKAARFLPVLAALLPLSLQGGVIPGRWDKVESLDLPVEVIVILEQGRRVEGSLSERTDKELVIETSRTDPFILKRSAIRRVLRARTVSDSTRDGTLLGTGLGFGIGFGTTVALEKAATASGFELAEENLTFAILGGLIGAGAGAAMGWAADRYRQTHEVLYTAR